MFAAQLVGDLQVRDDVLGREVRRRAVVVAVGDVHPQVRVLPHRPLELR